MSEHTFVARPGARLLSSMAVKSAAPLAPADGHFLAGFLEAEASFGLGSNNGGQGWQAWLSLNLRDDDADLLVDLARITALGVLTPVPARRTSNPQVVWKIASRPECLRLAELIGRYPLRGRKRAEAEVWCRAVRALRGGPRSAELPLAHQELHALRRYVKPEQGDRTPIDLPEKALAPYLGGFFTGEGHFSIYRRRARIVLKVRDDDRVLLEALAHATGLGSIYLSRAHGTSRPAAAWVIHRSDEMQPAVELLERVGLRGRKLREFEVWREAAVEAAKPRHRRCPHVIDDAAVQLKEIRAYPGPGLTVSRGDAHEAQRDAYAMVLKEAASLNGGDLTTTVYRCLRSSHPDWPTHNTIAIAFGSWAAGLDAAGLGDRCTEHGRAHAARRSREYTDDELQARRAARKCVLVAVTSLVRESATPPTVGAYLAHRAAHDRSLPSLGRLYNLFPAGWWSVLREAGLPARPRASRSRGP